jgi:hypothetical protein
MLQVITNVGVSRRPHVGLSRVTLPSMGWSRGDRLTLAALVLTVLGVVAAWLVVPEFRGWLRLDHQADPPSQAAIFSISGIVVDQATNHGIGQAAVVAVGRAEQSVTDDSGNFTIEFKGDAPKRVRLYVNKAGFQTLDTTVEPPAENLVLPLRRQ